MKVSTSVSVSGRISMVVSNGRFAIDAYKEVSFDKTYRRVEVNWPGCGSVSVADALLFEMALQEAYKRASLLEELRPEGSTAVSSFHSSHEDISNENETGEWQVIRRIIHWKMPQDNVAWFQVLELICEKLGVKLA